MDFFTRYCSSSMIFLAVSSSAPLSTSTTLADAALEASPSSLAAIQASKASFLSSLVPAARASFMKRSIRSRILRIPVAIPKPYSALSSNNELAQAGPFPSALTV